MNEFSEFENSLTNPQRFDLELIQAAERVVEEHKRKGLEGLVTGLQAVIINTEPELQNSAIEELIQYSGLRFQEAFQDSYFRTCVLRVPGFARVSFRRLPYPNPAKKPQSLPGVEPRPTVSTSSQYTPGDVRL